MQITMTKTKTMAAREVGIVLVTRIIRVYAADRMTMEGARERNLPAESPVLLQ